MYLTNRNLRHYLVLVVIGSLLILFAGKIPYRTPQYSHIDLARYRAMSEAAPGLNTSVDTPFVYRILAPWLAGILPFSTDTSFYVLNFMCLLGGLIAFYEWITIWTSNHLIALWTTLLFGLNRYLFGILSFNYFQLCDSLAFLLFILSLIALYQRKWIWFFPLLLLGIITRETAILLIPYGIVLLWIRDDSRSDWYLFMASSLVAIMLFISVRTFLIPDGVSYLWEQLSIGIQKLISPVTYAREFFNVFIPLSFVPLLFLKDLWEFTRKHMDLVVLFLLIFASTLFGMDYERLMLPASPIYYLFISGILIDYFFPAYQKRKGFTTPLILLFSMALISNLYHLWGIIQLPNGSITSVYTLIIDIAVAGVFLYQKKKQLPISKTN